MKAEFTSVWFRDGEEIMGSPKSVELPFRRVSARAIIVRRRDGCVLGTLHHEGGRFAFPGGAVEDGESTLQAVQRELTEENIVLAAAEWLSQTAVDYYEGFQELNVWHLVLVDDADVGSCSENIESQWLGQDEDVWYPFMHEKLVMALNRYYPELAKVAIVMQGD